MSNQVKVTITISPCCDRLKFLTDILHQARNLGLADTYVTAVENLILDIMPLVTANDELGLISMYESNLNNILTLRDNAFNTWKNEVKDQFTAVPITPIE